MADGEALPGAAREAILAWYGRAGRRLPFRATSDPWAILVSEAMAQQTQAARAGDAWTRFMDTFPTPAALAAATPADVLRAWHGLGYNRRALNLWRAAQTIVADHGGAVPATLAELEALPGVGPYTARAVAAIAFGAPVGAVDTNVRRVVGRITAGDPARLTARQLQVIADAAVPADRPGAWTHALMDLGATICAPRRPRCPACPAQAWCSFAAAAGPVAGSPTASSPTASSPTAGSPDATGPAPAADAVDLHRRRDTPPSPRPTTPFPATRRWLRGRLIDRLRAAPGDGWVAIEGPIGTHDPDAVASALDALAREGLVELDRGPQTGARRARLPLA